ncbi:unnamed protein product [Gordionus sp. m RMFG-2023]
MDHQDLVYKNDKISLPNQDIDNISKLSTLKQIISIDTWDNILQPWQKLMLMRLLPNFPYNDDIEKQKTLRMLLNGQKFDFENPLETFHDRLIRGFFTAKNGISLKLRNELNYIKFHKQLHAHNSRLLKEIVTLRNLVFQQAERLIPKENDVYNVSTFIPRLCPPLSFMLPVYQNNDSKKFNTSKDIATGSKLNLTSKDRSMNMDHTKRWKIIKNRIRDEIRESNDHKMSHEMEHQDSLHEISSTSSEEEDYELTFTNTFLSQSHLNKTNSKTSEPNHLKEI